MQHKTKIKTKIGLLANGVTLCPPRSIRLWCLHINFKLCACCCYFLESCTFFAWNSVDMKALKQAPGKDNFVDPHFCACLSCTFSACQQLNATHVIWRALFLRVQVEHSVHPCEELGQRSSHRQYHQQSQLGQLSGRQY